MIVDRSQPSPRTGRWVLVAALIPLTGFIFAKLAAGNERLVRAALPRCVFHEVTGMHCAGCGGTRAFFALTRGDLATAWRMNQLLVSGLVIGLILLGFHLYEKISGRRSVHLKLSNTGIWILFGIVVSFWILRNIPYWPFTYLAPF